jgi:hypothetical protein
MERFVAPHHSRNVHGTLVWILLRLPFFNQPNLPVDILRQNKTAVLRSHGSNRMEEALSGHDGDKIKNARIRLQLVLQPIG